jgi:CopG family nickel-responsive transcriptional regulator
MSTQHIHLDHDNCLEIVAIKGSAASTHKLANAIRTVKGIKHVTLGMSSTGKNI